MHDELLEFQKEIEDESYQPSRLVGNKPTIDRLRAKLRELHEREPGRIPEPVQEPSRPAAVPGGQPAPPRAGTPHWRKSKRPDASRIITLTQAVDKQFIEPEVDFSRLIALLRDYRDRLRLSQSQLAEIVGADHSYISRIENGTRRPSRAMIEKLTLAFGLQEREREEFFLAAGFSIGGSAVPLPKELAALRIYFKDGVLHPDQLAALQSQLEFLESVACGWRGTNLLGEEIVY